MPLYDFRCPLCNLQFEVSRPRNNAGDPAFCPQDQTRAERIWAPVASFFGRDRSMPEIPPLPPAHGPGDHGHSHGPGSHTH